MEKAVYHLISLLEIPQVWGVILTILIILTGFILKRAINHAFQSRLDEDIFIRGLYSDLKDYSSEQAHAARDAYLIIFEPESSSTGVHGKAFEEKLEIARQRIMRPLRTHIVRVDAATSLKINELHTTIRKYQVRYNDSKSEAQFTATYKDEFFKQSEECIDFLRVDKLAQRLGLIRKALGE